MSPRPRLLRTLLGAALLLAPTALRPAAAAPEWSWLTDPRMITGDAKLSVGAGIVSRDGTVVTWSASVDANFPQVLLRDRRTGRTEVVSTVNGRYPNGISYPFAVSATGRYVLFDSYASDLVPGDTNGQRDVFLRDRLRHHTAMISGRPGRTRDRAVWSAAMNADASLVVYTACTAAGDCTLIGHRVATRAEFTIAEHVAFTGALDLQLSDDGRYVVFASTEPLTDDDPRTNPSCSPDLFLRDLDTGSTTLLTGSLDPLGDTCGQLYADRFHDVTLGAGGACVVLVASGTNNERVFLRDRATGVTVRVQGATPQVSYSFEHAAVTADCQHVYYTATYDTAAEPNAPSGEASVYRWDHADGAVTRITPDLPLPSTSINLAGPATAAPRMGGVSTSGDGRVLVLQTSAGYDPADTDGKYDNYLHLT
ncbi:MAG TPA: hypothetical protein VFQ85_12940 [Mycobacteriales bacterium]|jgi:hypothetical protein|nr:hypothetical protein [Mycobacteriales bacterium]